MAWSSSARFNAHLSDVKSAATAEIKMMACDLKVTSDSGPGSFEGIMSAPVLDRDGEIIDALAFAPLPAHITIDIDHGLTVQTVVGSGEPYYDQDGILKVKGTFASTPLGQMTRTLVKEGHIRHMSVAFREALRELNEETGIVHIRKGELINCTITGIPANTATTIAAKVGARNSMKDAERIQTAHDYMVELGATCGEKHFTPDETFIGKDESARKKFAAADLMKSTDTEPPDTAAQAAVSGAEVDVARAMAELALTEAILALD